jgi:hypothetical protein
MFQLNAVSDGLNTLSSDISSDSLILSVTLLTLSLMELKCPYDTSF